MFAMAFLNSFSPSSPIFKPKLSAMASSFPHYTNAFLLVMISQLESVALTKNTCPYLTEPCV